MRATRGKTDAASSMVTTVAAILLAFQSLAFTVTAQSQCAAGSGTGVAEESKGNWYCSRAQAITYSSFPGHGYYNKVTNMDAETGQCQSEQYAYSGSLSPLNEELSLHVRGPVWLKQMAFYSPSTSSLQNNRMKRAGLNHLHAHAHNHHGQAGPVAHQRLQNRISMLRQALDAEAMRPRAVGDMVTATIDGKVVSWINEYAGPGAPAGTPTSMPETQAQAAVGAEPVVPEEKMVIHPSPAPSAVHKGSKPSSDIESDSAIASGDWVRHAFYDAEAGTAVGVTFLNHFGGEGGIPGTSDGGMAFGASLSYASSDGQSGATRPQILSNGLLKDNIEVVLMSGKACEGDDCGYTRPGGVAYHGFSGSQKVFLLEFTMPLTGNTAYNGDMPAVWLLNAQIPLTSQYGTNQECSCWTSGCGEFDIFEVLDPGDTKCKSTLHMAPAGGSSDWFERPTNDTVKVAIIFAGEDEKAVIRILDSRTEFGGSLEQHGVQEWITGPSTVFKLEV